MLVLSHQRQRQKKQKTTTFICEPFDTFATHSDLVHDVTDMDCWEQNGSTHGRVFATFKRQFLSNKQDQKSNEKLLCILFFLNPIPLNTVHEASSL